MARIRTIKPEFWSSEQVMECSSNARLLFIGMWNFADDEGRMTNSAKRIKAQVFPSDEMSSDTVRGMLDELERNSLIKTYVVDNVEYIQITGWHHQKIDKAQPSKIPPPVSAPSTISSDQSSNGSRIVDVGKEGNGKEGKKENAGKPAVFSPQQIETLHGEFYLAYPKHVDPAISKKAFEKAIKTGVDPSHIIEAAKRLASAHAKAGTPKNFIKGPAVWLNAGGYDSEDLPLPAPSPPRRGASSSGPLWRPD